jgi:hypothetical protein
MPALYVLSVPEFQPLIDYAEAAADLTVTHLGDYRKIEAAGEITIRRAATGLGQAVWFGALVGGIEGEILEFNEKRLMIGPNMT